ncbi:MAG: LTA synthase family protein [Gammaproteobacteria bacterium]|nr:LTA synthase family protein [Gammaproteobacteria bacterium]
MSFLFGVVLAAHVALFTPLTLYLGNSDEFSSGFSSMLPNLLLFLAAFAALAALIGLLLPARAYRAFVAVLAMLGLLVWVQGNFLVWDYGPLDGRHIDWGKGAWRGWLDMAVWVLALGLVFRLDASRRQILLNAALAVFAVQLVFSAIAGVRDRSLLVRAESAVPADEALSETYDFSRSRNVLHLVMDGFQTDIFEELIGEDQNRQDFARALEGFTLYRNNLGAFPYTHMSLPALVSGKTYRNHESIETFRASTFGNKSILRSAMAAGYELDVAAAPALANWYRLGGYTNSFDVADNLHADPGQAVIDESARLLDLSLLRTVPHFIKRIVYNEQRWLVQPVVSDSRVSQLQYFSHRFFLRRWHESMTATRDAPVYKMVHLMLSHNPMVVNAECEFADETLYATRENVLNQSRCSLVEAVQLLEKMKELGVYDNTLIVVMGDHGAWVRPKDLKVETEPDGTRKPMLLSSAQHALATPLLAIKVPGAGGNLRISNAPTWTVDVPDTISAALGLADDFGRRDILTLAEDEARDRRFHYYDYDRGELNSDYLQPIQEYIVEGHVYDVSSWRLGELYSPD